MGTKFKKASLLGLFAIYVALLGVHVVQYTVAVHEYQHQATEMAFLDYDSASFGLLPLTECSVQAPLQTAGPTSGTYSIYLDVEQSIGRIYSARYSRYVRDFERVLIKYRKSDLIFPFHYFW